MSFCVNLSCKLPEKSYDQVMSANAPKANASQSDLSLNTQPLTLVVVPDIKAPARSALSDSPINAQHINIRHIRDRRAEAIRLCESIALEVIETSTPRLERIRPASYLGSGSLSDLHDLVEDKDIGLVVFDCSLTPTQQRNLERALECKVIDRTGLILEIFGARARSHEGRLQVELASLTFQRSRLVRSWTHLERQRGGFGFTGGPGERQIEIDRRLIDQRIGRLNRELERVKRTRALHRKARARVPYPVIALVGYTNAGKSTLFNQMTESRVLAKNMLFSTLDPTMRRVDLPNGQPVILSDTVGFISDLPHELVAAFHATLEDVEDADIILHVVDAAAPDHRLEMEDVRQVLATLDLKKEAPVVTVFNKTDLLPPVGEPDSFDKKDSFDKTDSSGNRQCRVSALTGQGMDQLLLMIEAALRDSPAQGFVTHQYQLNVFQDRHFGKAYAFLHQHGHQLRVIKDDPEKGQQVFEVTWSRQDDRRYRQQFLHASPASA